MSFRPRSCTLCASVLQMSNRWTTDGSPCHSGLGVIHCVNINCRIDQNNSNLCYGLQSTGIPFYNVLGVSWLPSTFSTIPEFNVFIGLSLLTGRRVPSSPVTGPVPSPVRKSRSRSGVWGMRGTLDNTGGTLTR